MKIAIITDTHVGARSSSSVFRGYFDWWYETVFFPTCKAQGVEQIIHGGDFFDNRNAITLPDINFVQKNLAGKIREYGIPFDVILGNHDVAFKNTNEVHSLSILQTAAPELVRVYTGPELVEYGGQPFAMIPWINASNYDETLQFVNNLDASAIVVGHFEFIGAKMYANSSLCEHGLAPALFKQFKAVWSGHFHHGSVIDNIRYIGSAFHLTWQDYNDWRGFWIYDTDTGEITLHENEHCLFVAVAFDYEQFKNWTATDYEQFSNRFVRLVVQGEYQKLHLQEVISKINAAKPHDLQIINDEMVSALAMSDEQATESTAIVNKSLVQYIRDYVTGNEAYNQPAVVNMMEQLHSQAVDASLEGE